MEGYRKGLGGTFSFFPVHKVNGSDWSSLLSAVEFYIAITSNTVCKGSNNSMADSIWKKKQKNKKIIIINNRMHLPSCQKMTAASVLESVQVKQSQAELEARGGRG